MKRIAETDFSEIYLDDTNESFVIKFKEKEDYPHFKTVLETREGLTAFFKTFYNYFLEKLGIKKVKDQEKLEKLLKYLENHRKDYLKGFQAGDYTRRILHYIQMLKVVLGMDGIASLHLARFYNFELGISHNWRKENLE